MTPATDTDIKDIKTSIEANTKAIGELTTSLTSLREEMRVGFANVTTQVTRLDGKIDKLAKPARRSSRFYNFAATTYQKSPVMGL